MLHYFYKHIFMQLNILLFILIYNKIQQKITSAENPVKWKLKFMKKAVKDLVLWYSKELLYGHMMLHFLLGSIS